MQEITQAVECTIPGFEQVRVVYNLMASEEQADKFYRQAGKGDSHTGVIAAVEGWDAKTYGDDPWDYQRSPMVFRLWAARKGWSTAIKAYLDDPN